jgi:galactoside O-acetyltransferase
MSFHSPEELRGFGFASLGQDVKISTRAALYGTSRMSIGSNTRIDDFCVLSAGDGGIVIGEYVHIAVMCSLIGHARIELGDFSGISGRTCVYSSSDDFSGSVLTNPTVPQEYTNVDSRPVHLGRHVIVGAGSVILPGTVMKDGAALGALSLAKGVLEEFTMYSGVPAKKIKLRKRDLLRLEVDLNRVVAASEANR